jgi:hypothetical protein
VQANSHQLREGVRRPTLQEIFEGRAGPTPPYYEMMRSPSVEKLSVNFSQISYRHFEDLDADVKEGRMVLKKMPDRSSLYLDARLTEADQEYISRAFWHQRWSRYVSFTKLWGPMLVVPPIVLFILGWAILWICRGFKTA